MITTCTLSVALVCSMVLLQTGTCETIVKRSVDNSPACSYNVNVLATGETCPSGASDTALNRLRHAMHTQHANLEDKLNAILARVTHNCTESGDQASSGGGGAAVNYKRWGRTTCPGTATLVYAGTRTTSSHCVAVNVQIDRADILHFIICHHSKLWLLKV